MAEPYVPYSPGVLREQLIKVAEEIRARFQMADIDNRWTLEIVVKGSVDREDATLEFKLDCTGNYNNAVSARSVGEVTHELLHRMGFDREHQAQLLTYDANKEAELERLQAPQSTKPF